MSLERPTMLGGERLWGFGEQDLGFGARQRLVADEDIGEFGHDGGTFGVGKRFGEEECAGVSDLERIVEGFGKA